jgi:hypothetical protein
MTKLKLGPLADDKPVKLTVELPAPLFEDLRRYGEILGEGSPIPPVRLIAPMLARFMETDRAFRRHRAQGN